ncbi:MAG: DUF362 domain-containing protein [Anaerolineales bacterium]
MNKKSKIHLTRKQFLQLSAAGTAGLLAGCQTAPADTAIPATPTADATTAAARRKEVLRFYPDATSRVVHTHGEGVWEGDVLSPVVLRRMLDASITRQTGIADAREAWAALFSPDDRIAIKVNAFHNSLIWTHVPLVTAVTDSLQDAGIPADRITLTDLTTAELETAGFTINRDSAGIRCYGADTNYKEYVTINDAAMQLNPVLADCTAIINMPVLKAHMLTGITFAMKNHFGSVSLPRVMHYTAWDDMAALNALPQIKDRTRLIIGDILEANLQYFDSFPYWVADYRGDSILMGFDPVAHDKIGLDILTRLLAEKGENVSLLDAAERCLAGGAARGLGTNLPENMELMESTV